MLTEDPFSITLAFAYSVYEQCREVKLPGEKASLVCTVTQLQDAEPSAGK